MKHKLEKIWWKITKGFTCCDAYGANYWIAKKIEPILRNMLSHTYSYPPSLTIDDWRQILKDIADGFAAFIELEENFDLKTEKKLHIKVNKGLRLFNKYFYNLWI
jgi:hypothetical protein